MGSQCGAQNKPGTFVTDKFSSRLKHGPAYGLLYGPSYATTSADFLSILSVLSILPAAAGRGQVARVVLILVAAGFHPNEVLKGRGWLSVPIHVWLSVNPHVSKFRQLDAPRQLEGGVEREGGERGTGGG